MTSYVVDSWAWVEYLRGSKAGQVVKKELDSGSEMLTNVVTLAELASKLRRERLDLESAWRAITALSKTIIVRGPDAKDVGVLHATMKETTPNFSLADAFVLQTARKHGCRILTGDPDFRGMKEARIMT